MFEAVIKHLKIKYEDLLKLAIEVDEKVLSEPENSIVSGRKLIELLSKKICDFENLEEVKSYNQFDRIRYLRDEEFLTQDIYRKFNNVRSIGNKVVHDSVDSSLLSAIMLHRDIYDILSWFIEVYIDPNFIAPTYKEPVVVRESNDNKINEDLLNEVKQLITNNVTATAEVVKEEKEDVVVDDSDIVLDRQCLIQQLSKLKESSMEAVESLNNFSDFKKYMHIERDVQKQLDNIITESEKSNKAELILVCGSVGDGKSHIISYFKNNMPDIMQNFVLHNDATESLGPTKTALDTLNDVLDDFSDEKIDSSDKKLILAINLGTLNNFIESEYAYRFTKLKKYVEDKKILEQNIESNDFDENSNIQYINFSDYHLFTLKDEKVESKYIKGLINRITDQSEINLFYKSYKTNCVNCKNCNKCPIKANFELLSKENVQDSVVELLVESMIKNKIIISTRALLNFFYEILVARTVIDVNDSMLKDIIGNLNSNEYVRALTPNILFTHKELSYIFESLNKLDPLNIRNEKIDDFVIKFNNSINVMKPFKEYIDYSKGYIKKIEDIDFENTQDKKIKPELLKLFIRSYYLCGKGDIFNLKDEIYYKFIANIYNWNRGNKRELMDLYSEVIDGILKWNGESEENCINIFIGKKQTQYKVSHKMKLEPMLSNLPKEEDSELKKFLTTMTLEFKCSLCDKSFKVDIDFSLYKLLMKINRGYRPNKKDKNQFIKFIEFINKLHETAVEGSDTSLLFSQKNRENNKKYKLEYNEQFEIYKFVEIE